MTMAMPTNTNPPKGPYTGRVGAADVDLEYSAFKHFYDALGFPFDLTELMTEEVDLTVDSAGFATNMETQNNNKWMTSGNLSTKAFCGNAVMCSRIDGDRGGLY
jgi:hypothetical protein